MGLMTGKPSVNAAKQPKAAKVRKELKKKIGRPPALSPEMQDHLLGMIEQGRGNREACSALGINPDTLYATIARDLDFSDRYQAAKRASVDALVDQARDVNAQALAAESGAAVAAHKHLADALRWEAARRAPQRWGEKAIVEVTGGVDLSDREELAKRLAFLEAMMAPQHLPHGQVIDITPTYGPDVGASTDPTEPD